MIESLEKMLAKGVDNSLLRFGLGKGYLDLGENAKAVEHFQRCVEIRSEVFGGLETVRQGPSGADRLCSRATGLGERHRSRQNHGDKQAEKEMTVFLKKLDRQAH